MPLDNNNNPYTETPTGDEGQSLRCTSIEKSDGDPRGVIRIQKSVYKDGRKHLFPGSEIAVTQVRPLLESLEALLPFA